MKIIYVYLPLVLILFTEVSIAQTESSFISLAETIEEAPAVTKEEVSYPKIEVSPNPTKGLFKLNVQGLEEKGSVEIEIINSYGHRIFLEKLGLSGANIEYAFDLIPMKPGVYTVKITQNDKISTLKLVKE